jgi:RimJ/RimL family protein N-acetyltransferase/8-oxo-dGTP pyrophosphatase MutT (NUDIX family)
VPSEQPTLTDGVVTLRPWRDDDVAEAVAGHDDEMALWLGRDAADVTEQTHSAAIARWRQRFRAGEQASFVVEHDGRLVGSVDLTREGSAGASLRWALYAGHRGHGHAARAVRVLVDWAFSDPDQGGWGLQRVEARIDPRNDAGRRVATRAGMRLEGVQRIAPGMGDRADATSYAVFARLATDPPLSDPESFRSLLNSFLPRKRAIAQMLVRDPEGRVLLCQLTYKRDWDLPGGVVEVGESPQLAVRREVEEELGLDIDPGGLLLTDWLPAWGGWDDAVCLVFDGGTHQPEVLGSVVMQEREIRDVRFCTLDEVEDLAADFTARRIRAAVSGDHPYTESGR